MLTTTVTHATEATVVTLTGELDMENAPQLAACIDDQLAHGRVHLIVNLKGLTFCDSRGIATLIAAAARCQRAGGALRLSAATGSVARVLHITGVGELLASDTPLNTGFGTPPPQRPAT